MKNRLRCIKFRISGRVQGVWFRAYTRDKALSLNIEGWVTNNADKSVSGEAVGSERNMEKFITILKKGSPNSKVEDTLIEESPEIGQYQGFEIRI
jgi:acylphosphatase